MQTESRRTEDQSHKHMQSQPPAPLLMPSWGFSELQAFNVQEICSLVSHHLSSTEMYTLSKIKCIDMCS